ncbi:MAG TPA: flagellar hook-associated protein FlgK [Paenalcaligenes hominis]|uniref:Flagellar hook-associated protein 1 n=1 Tax=Paenalcaligenes hominis TaxID=643674 RepID=A0A9D3AB01_9BURK|nr:flagellar hook-associated protein FlgK [Paenalcaligenes hominis]NJB65966.1 flagellar hook-associated protein 1 FlgK [Paenalcaligenes hominis]GGE71064.1 flagellar hook-associated protein 1 [Paenalcaligenes hominis]HJH24307.1 flagellar hook-associated protein FlgK [Paenalcaligenes hominis]
MNLYGLGLSALNTAQVNLMTTGHNINNAAVEGYNRQTVLQQTTGARATGAGYIGRGVQAVTVQRAYDSFLHNQVVKSQSQGAALVTYGNEIAQLNNLFSDRTAGVSPAIQKFFESVQAVASAPADPAARQEMLGRSDSLVTQFKEANRFIDNQRHDINTQLTTVVAQINSYVSRIHDMNDQITKARASVGGAHAPNDLLDQREQLVAELNQLVDVKVYEQDGNFNLALGSGQILLGGPTQFPLTAVPSQADPTRHVVAYTYGHTNGQPNLAEIDDGSFSGGQLAGLMKYRTDTLDPAQNALGRLAIAISTEFNAIHNTGYDLTGAKGGDYFSVKIGQPMASDKNKSAASLRVELDSANALTGQDYEFVMEDSALKYRTLPNGKLTDLPAANDKGEIIIDGLKIDQSAMAGAVDGDLWRVTPTRNSADSFAVEIKQPGDIAAAGQDADGNPLGSADGSIALKLAELQNSKTMGKGSLSFNDAFSQLVNRVAVNGQQNATAAKAQKNLIEQNFSAQQALSGVNLDEEYLKLNQYADQYRAASRLIDVGTNLFDTLLNLRA